MSNGASGGPFSFVGVSGDRSTHAVSVPGSADMRGAGIACRVLVTAPPPATCLVASMSWPRCGTASLRPRSRSPHRSRPRGDCSLSTASAPPAWRWGTPLVGRSRSVIAGGVVGDPIYLGIPPAVFGMGIDCPRADECVVVAGVHTSPGSTVYVVPFVDATPGTPAGRPARPTATSSIASLRTAAWSAPGTSMSRCSRLPPTTANPSAR